MWEKSDSDKLRYLSFHNEYSAKGTRDNSLQHRVCFADILNRGTIKEEHYELKVYKGAELALKHNKSNSCFLNKDELSEHLSRAKQIVNFEFSIEETDHEYSGNSYPGYLVKIDLDAPHVYHRYVLTWFRYAYEYPFNLLLMDARRLQEELIDEDIENLFVTCADCFSGSYPASYNTVHSISVSKNKFLTIEGLKQKLSEHEGSDCRCMNVLYPKTTAAIDCVPNTEDCQYLGYWRDDEEFQKRREIYLKAYNKLKRLKS